MKYLVANWKANLSSDQVANFCREWLDLIDEKNIELDKEIIVAPTSIFYSQLQQSDRKFAVGLQDISIYSGGAHTGEVTITNLQDLPPKYAIIGHSERRRDFGEDNQLVLKKAQRLWSLGTIPIICFDLPEMDELSALLSPYLEQEMLLAYEPVSAISTSGSAGNLAALKLKELMIDFRTKFGGKPIIYGGSVKPENAGEYGEVVNGLLIGSASLKAESFYQIVRAF